uniref:Uncharacterized protein n=1 Tax=Corethrella appendiculata TaxID=1370023 RepID=U5ELN9_9DIPT
MGGVDTSKWKPRKARGTLSYRFGNWFSLGVITAGVSIFSIYYFLIIDGNKFVEKYTEKFLTLSEEEKDRKFFIRNSFLPQKSGDQIRKYMKEFQNDTTR